MSDSEDLKKCGARAVWIPFWLYEMPLEWFDTYYEMALSGQYVMVSTWGAA